MTIHVLVGSFIDNSAAGMYVTVYKALCGHTSTNRNEYNTNSDKSKKRAVTCEKCLEKLKK